MFVNWKYHFSAKNKRGLTPLLSESSQYDYFTSARVSLAIASSSFVGITNTLTFEPGFVSSFSVPLNPVLTSLSKSYSKITKVAAYLLADIIVILTDSGCKRDTVHAVHGSCISADVFCHAV